MQAKPLKMLLVMLAGWINRQQQEAIEYLKEENRILREKLVLCPCNKVRQVFLPIVLT